jgi:hypothetical protein
MAWSTLLEEDCVQRYAELAATAPLELENLWAEFFESAHYSGS